MLNHELYTRVYEIGTKIVRLGTRRGILSAIACPHLNVPRVRKPTLPWSSYQACSVQGPMLVVNRAKWWAPLLPATLLPLYVTFKSMPTLRSHHTQPHFIQGFYRIPRFTYYSGRNAFSTWWGTRGSIFDVLCTNRYWTLMLLPDPFPWMRSPT